MTPRMVSVLIIDDEEFLRQVIQDYLEDEGRFRVFAADSGEAGLAVLELEHVDVCLVDLRISGINGVEFMTQAQAAHPELRFLVHTGSPEEQLPKAAIQTIPGFRGVLYKPLADIAEIAQAIDAALG